MTLDTVFLDRDGTINVKAPEGAYVTRPDEVRLLPGAAAAIRRLNDAGVRVVVVTNQRGIALGRMSEGDLAAVHERLAALLAAEGARVDLILHCPHGEDECDCRKPGPGLVRQAVEDEPAIDLSASLLIGDSWRDEGAARSAGIPSMLLSADGPVPDLAAAVEHLLGQASARS